MATLTANGTIALSSLSVRVTPQEIYTDAETGYQVWRMTCNPVSDITQYYTHETMSPNGRYLVFRTNRYPYIYSVDSDGRNEKPIGSYADWITNRGVDFSTNNSQGWWSRDSKTYYIFKSLFAIDIPKFHAGESADSFISQISTAYASSFFYPMVSPDGRTLFGIENFSDVSFGTSVVKFIGTDGSSYRDFVAPGHTSGGFDVTHGWLGNTKAWYLNNNQFASGPGDTANLSTDVPIVFDAVSGTYAGALNVGTTTWDGLFTHPHLSQGGVFKGNGDGYIAGHGSPGLHYANTKYWTSDFVVGDKMRIVESTSNDEMYTLASTGAVYDSENDQTRLYFVEALVDDTVDGIVERWGE